MAPLSNTAVEMIVWLYEYSVALMSEHSLTSLQLARINRRRVLELPKGAVFGRLW